MCNRTSQHNRICRMLKEKYMFIFKQKILFVQEYNRFLTNTAVGNSKIQEKINIPVPVTWTRIVFGQIRYPVIVLNNPFRVLYLLEQSLQFSSSYTLYLYCVWNWRLFDLGVCFALMFLQKSFQVIIDFLDFLWTNVPYMSTFELNFCLCCLFSLVFKLI